MEFRYNLTYITDNKLYYFIVRNDTIIDSSKEITNISVGKNPRNFLEQLYVWGRTFTVEIILVGLTDIRNLIAIVEEPLEPYISKDEKDRVWVKLLYPTGRFGWIEYDGTVEDRQRIIMEHTKLFGIRGMDDLHSMTTKDYKKAVENTKNKFEILV